MAMTTETPAATQRLRMTEEEFDAWCDEDARAEFVDGEVIIMSPVSRAHSTVGQFLIPLLNTYVSRAGIGGELFGPEFQIRLRAGLRRVPDLMYVAHEHLERVTDTYVNGPPDAAWEIVSAESVERDWREKYYDYQAAGVREYWVLDPSQKVARLYRLGSAGDYAPVEETEGRLVSEVLPGFWIRTEWLWQSPRPDAVECIREMGVTL